MTDQQQQPKKTCDKKIFRDSIHGMIEMDSLCVKIIDTPEFQRLRSIKQLGMCYFVYPGACHNRFEHSLGVCYLAGRFVEELRERQKDLGITKQDILCVKIAGLCHDLGHGPFSHVFDKAIVSKVLKDENDHHCFRHHEERSRLILERLIENNELKQAFKEHLDLDDDDDDVEYDDHISFIGDLITASLDEKDRCEKKSELGKDPEKQFLFEIVANKSSGIDVDKWDYFARDCHMLGMKNDFDHIRCMKLARVIDVPPKGRQICFRDKEVFNLYEMFHTRFSLHTRVYQHHANKIIERMVADVLLEASEHLNVGKKQKKMSTIIKDKDCDGVCLLTDDILSCIWNSADPDLEKAKKILENIKKRELYQQIGETRLTYEQAQEGEGKIKADIVKALGTRNALEVLFAKIDYGKKNENPVDSVLFYDKRNQDKAFTIPREKVSHLLPHDMYEKLVIVCYKGNEQSVDDLRTKFRQWCTFINFRVHGEQPTCKGLHKSHDTICLKQSC